MVLVFRSEAAVENFSSDVNQQLGDTQDPSRMGKHPETGRYSTQPVSMSVSQSSRDKRKSNPQLEVLGRFADGLQKIGDVVHEKEEKRVAAECYNCLRSMVCTIYDYFIFTDNVVCRSLLLMIILSRTPRLGWVSQEVQWGEGPLALPLHETQTWLRRLRGHWLPFISYHLFALWIIGLYYSDSLWYTFCLRHAFGRRPYELLLFILTTVIFFIAASCFKHCLIARNVS